MGPWVYKILVQKNKKVYQAHLLFCHVVLESFSLEMSVDRCSFQDFFKASQGWKFGNFRALFCFFQLF